MGNGDISKWDVSSVIRMGFMFQSASSFKRTLCGKWKTSTASKNHMFDGSPGKLCTSISKTTSIETLTLTPVAIIAVVVIVGVVAMLVIKKQSRSNMQMDTNPVHERAANPSFEITLLHQQKLGNEIPT